MPHGSLVIRMKSLLDVTQSDKQWVYLICKCNTTCKNIILASTMSIIAKRNYSLTTRRSSLCESLQNRRRSSITTETPQNRRRSSVTTEPVQHQRLTIKTEQLQQNSDRGESIQHVHSKSQRDQSGLVPQLYRTQLGWDREPDSAKLMDLGFYSIAYNRFPKLKRYSNSVHVYMYFLANIIRQVSAYETKGIHSELETW